MSWSARGMEELELDDLDEDTYTPPSSPDYSQCRGRMPRMKRKAVSEAEGSNPTARMRPEVNGHEPKRRESPWDPVSRGVIKGIVSAFEQCKWKYQPVKDRKFKTFLPRSVKGLPMMGDEVKILSLRVSYSWNCQALPPPSRLRVSSLATILPKLKWHVAPSNVGRSENFLRHLAEVHALVLGPGTQNSGQDPSFSSLEWRDQEAIALLRKEITNLSRLLLSAELDLSHEAQVIGKTPLLSTRIFKLLALHQVMLDLHLHIFKSSPVSHKPDRFSEDTEFAARERELIERKRRAVAAEDFKTAQECKELLTALVSEHKYKKLSAISRSTATRPAAEEASEYCTELMRVLFGLCKRYPRLIDFEGTSFSPKNPQSFDVYVPCVLSYSPVVSLWQQIVRVAQGIGIGGFWTRFETATDEYLEGLPTVYAVPRATQQKAMSIALEIKRKYLGAKPLPASTERQYERLERIETVWDTLLTVVVPVLLQSEDPRGIGTVNWKFVSELVSKSIQDANFQRRYPQYSYLLISRVWSLAQADPSGDFLKAVSILWTTQISWPRVSQDRIFQVPLVQDINDNQSINNQFRPLAATDPLPSFLKLLVCYFRRFSSDNRESVAALKRAASNFLRPSCGNLEGLRNHISTIVNLSMFFPDTESAMFLQILKHASFEGKKGSPETLRLVVDGFRGLARIRQSRGMSISPQAEALWRLIANVQNRYSQAIRAAEANLTATKALSAGVVSGSKAQDLYKVLSSGIRAFASLLTSAQPLCPSNDYAAVQGISIFLDPRRLFVNSMRCEALRLLSKLLSPPLLTRENEGKKNVINFDNQPAEMSLFDELFGESGKDGRDESPRYRYLQLLSEFMTRRFDIIPNSPNHSLLKALESVVATHYSIVSKETSRKGLASGSTPVPKWSVGTRFGGSASDNAAIFKHSKSESRVRTTHAHANAPIHTETVSMRYKYRISPELSARCLRLLAHLAVITVGTKSLPWERFLDLFRTREAVGFKAVLTCRFIALCLSYSQVRNSTESRSVELLVDSYADDLLRLWVNIHALPSEEKMGDDGGDLGDETVQAAFGRQLLNNPTLKKWFVSSSNILTELNHPRRSHQILQILHIIKARHSTLDRFVPCVRGFSKTLITNAKAAIGWIGTEESGRGVEYIEFCYQCLEGLLTKFSPVVYRQGTSVCPLPPLLDFFLANGGAAALAARAGAYALSVIAKERSRIRRALILAAVTLDVAARDRFIQRHIQLCVNQGLEELRKPKGRERLTLLRSTASAFTKPGNVSHTAWAALIGRCVGSRLDSDRGREEMLNLIEASAFQTTPSLPWTLRPLAIPLLPLLLSPLHASPLPRRIPTSSRARIYRFVARLVASDTKRQREQKEGQQGADYYTRENLEGREEFGALLEVMVMIGVVELEVCGGAGSEDKMNEGRIVAVAKRLCRSRSYFLSCHPPHSYSSSIASKLLHAKPKSQTSQLQFRQRISDQEAKTLRDAVVMLLQHIFSFVGGEMYLRGCLKHLPAIARLGNSASESGGQVWWTYLKQRLPDFALKSL